jgi:hypothetical protein
LSSLDSDISKKLQSFLLSSGPDFEPRILAAELAH